MQRCLTDTFASDPDFIVKLEIELKGHTDAAKTLRSRMWNDLSGSGSNRS